MKKLFIALMAVVAMTVVSCSKGNSAGVSEDSTEMVSQLGENLNAGDGNKFVQMLSGVKDNVINLFKNNPGKAKEYLAAAQKFLSENKDKVTEVIGKISDSKIASQAQGLIDQISAQDITKLIPGL